MATGILLFLLYDVLAHGVVPVEEALEEGSRRGRLVARVHVAGRAVRARRRHRADEPRLLRRLDRRPTPQEDARPGACVGGRIRGSCNTCRVDLRSLAGADDRDRDRPPQFLRGSRHRPVCRQRGGCPGADARGRLRPPQRAEGFGIVAPLSGAAERPTWRFLLMLGVIGGGPTFVGTLIGQAWTSEALSVAFLALAAGSILYVIIELANVNRAARSQRCSCPGRLIGWSLPRLRHRLRPRGRRRLGIWWAGAQRNGPPRWQPPGSPGRA